MRLPDTRLTTARRVSWGHMTCLLRKLAVKYKIR
jgi:hypothetical protein